MWLEGQRLGASAWHRPNGVRGAGSGAGPRERRVCQEESLQRTADGEATASGKGAGKERNEKRTLTPMAYFQTHTHTHAHTLFRKTGRCNNPKHWGKQEGHGEPETERDGCLGWPAAGKLDGDNQVFICSRLCTGPWPLVSVTSGFMGTYYCINNKCW